MRKNSKRKARRVKHSLKGLMMLIFTVCVIVTSLVIGGASNFLNYVSTVKTAELFLSDMSTQVVYLVDSKISELMSSVEGVAAMDVIKDQSSNQKDLTDVLIRENQRLGFIEMNLINTNGDIIAASAVGRTGNNIKDKEYFQKAIQGTTNITEPVFSTFTNGMMVFVAAPITHQNRVIGVLVGALDGGIISGIVNGLKVAETGYVAMVSADGVALAHPKHEDVINSVNLRDRGDKDPAYKGISAAVKTVLEQDSGFVVYNFSGANRYCGYDTVSTGWVVMVIAPESEILDDTLKGIWMSMGSSLILIIAGLIVSVIVANRIVNPIAKLSERILDMANGDLTSPVESVRRDNEIKLLAESATLVRDNVLKLTQKVNTAYTEYNEGDFDARIDIKEFAGEYKTLAQSINSLMDTNVHEVLTILDAYDKICKGDFNAEMIQFKGKKVLATEMFESMKGSLMMFSQDIEALIKGAGEGVLNVSMDTSKYYGDWRKMADNANQLLVSIAKPINEANAILAELAEGNFDLRVNKNYRGSFLMMMTSFEKMIDSVGSYIYEITDVLGDVANGRLNRNISRDFVGNYDLIKQSINTIIDSLRQTISDIQNSAETVSSGARQVSESSMILAEGSSYQASSIEELNASIETINAQTIRNAKQAQAARDFTIKSIKVAKNANLEMEAMLESMRGISESSDNISKILRAIDDIAFQTNLLALNASVEASRAGVHGQGFGVVAEEVRSLAGRSQRAAKETAELIEQSLSRVQEGSEIAISTANSLKAIVADVNHVSTTIERIFGSSKEQTESISQINEGITKISAIVQSNSSTSEESASAAQVLNSQATILTKMVGKFRM